MHASVNFTNTRKPMVQWKIIFHTIRSFFSSVDIFSSLLRLIKIDSTMIFLKFTEAIVGYICYLIFFELFCITKYRELNIKYIYLHLFSCNSNYTLYNVFCCKIANCYNVIYILFPNLHYFRSANFFTAQVPLAKATFCKIE